MRPTCIAHTFTKTVTNNPFIYYQNNNMNENVIQGESVRMSERSQQIYASRFEFITNVVDNNQHKISVKSFVRYWFFPFVRLYIHSFIHFRFVRICSTIGFTFFRCSRCCRFCLCFDFKSDSFVKMIYSNDTFNVRCTLRPEQINQNYKYYVCEYMHTLTHTHTRTHVRIQRE